jgi:hypothetical protein
MASTTNIANAFISINDIVNNFLISYTGPGKIIPDSKRTEVVFHARRCLQEFAYETIKSKFTETKPSVSTGGPLPLDYYTLPNDFVAMIEVFVTDSFGNVNVLTETSSTSPSLGEYYINYTTFPKQIRYGNSGALEQTYLSNALTTDETAAIPKLAEEAMYACMIYAVLANRENTNPNVLQRLLIEKTDKLEKAKSRLVFTNF